MSLLDEFDNWNKITLPELQFVSELMAEPLSDEPEKLIKDLIAAEAWNARLGALLAQADNWLDRYKFDALPSRENRTETERKVLMDRQVSPIRLVRDTLDHFCDSLKQRLILGESILSYYKTTYAGHQSPTVEKIF